MGYIKPKVLDKLKDCNYSDNRNPTIGRGQNNSELHWEIDSLQTLTTTASEFTLIDSWDFSEGSIPVCGMALIYCIW